MPSFEYEKFQEPRPPFFSPRISTYPGKQLSFSDGVEDVTTFDQALAEKEALINQYWSSSSDSDYGSTTDKKNLELKNAEKELTKIIVAREMSKIHSGASFIPREILAKIEMTGRKDNYEDVDSPNYVNYEELLGTPFYSSTDVNALAAQIFGSKYYEIIQAQKFPAEDNTLPHNTNIYGLDSNIVKESDTEAREVFQNSSYFSGLHNQFMNPRNILNKIMPGFYQKMRSVMTDIQNTKLPVGYEDVESFQNPFVSADDHDLNWENAIDPYSDNQSSDNLTLDTATLYKTGATQATDTSVKTFDINANNNTIIMSKMWRLFDEEQSFYMVNSLWEDLSRFTSTITAMVGRSSAINELVTSNADSQTEKNALEKRASEIEVALETTDETETAEQKLLRQEALIKQHIEDWWAKVEPGVDEVTALTIGMAISSVSAILDLADFTEKDNVTVNSADAKSKQTGFQEKMINDYFSYLNKTVMDEFLGTGKLKQEQFGTTGNAKTQWNLLIKSGYIDRNGNILKPIEPNDSKIQVGGLTEAESLQFSNILNQAASGTYSLETTDKTEVNGKTRQNFQLKCADGQVRSMSDIISLIGSGSDYKEKLTNTDQAYQTLMQMVTSMTAITDSAENSTGELPLEKLSNGQYQLTVYPNAEWQEYSPLIETTDGTRVVTDNWQHASGPLTMTFDTKEEATAFCNSIRGLVSIMEPVLGLFLQKNASMTVLKDNTGSIDSIDFIEEGMDGYRMWTDQRLNSDFFKTAFWEEASADITKRVVKKVANNINNKMQINRLSSMKHNKEVEEYKEKEEEFNESEYDRVKGEVKREDQKIREENEWEAYRLMLEKARQNELKEHEMLKKKSEQESAAAQKKKEQA